MFPFSSSYSAAASACKKRLRITHLGCSGRCFTTSLLSRQQVSQSANATALLTGKDTKSKGVQRGNDAPKTSPKLKGSLKILQRPLGVKEMPTTVQRSWRDNMLDDETRKTQREKLLKEATKGYFSELSATREHGGKTWIAPKVLIRGDKSLYFPDIKGTPLNGNDKVHTTDLLLGKVSIVSMMSSKISEVQSEMFVGPTHQRFATHPLFQHIRINLQENLLKSLLVSLFAGSIRKSVPPGEWSQYLISSQNMDYLRDDIGMTNRHLVYIYLVDPGCRIRWAACADPMPQEAQALEVCTEVLLKRHSAEDRSTKTE